MPNKESKYPQAGPEGPAQRGRTAPDTPARIRARIAAAVGARILPFVDIAADLG